MSEEPPVGVHHHDRGMRAIGKLADGRVNVVLGEPYAGPLGAATASELSGALVAAYGRDFGVHDITWLSRFTDAALQATTYRDRRVLIAGDAAHVHSPMGGQGLNLGVQDAVNLGWKLAQVVRGTSDDRLLDTYEAERHPVGASVLRTTLALTAISRGDDRTQALRETLSEVLRMDGPRRHLAAMSSGLDLRYDLGDGHPLLGRRMPDLELVVDGGPRRLFTFLHSARPVLLDLGGDVDVGAWADRVPRIVARYEGAWALPVIGEVAAPRAVLVRPDGHVAWVAEGSDRGLRDALTKWFGAPNATPIGGDHS